MAFKHLLACIIGMGITISSFSQAQDNFNQYVEGALKVYSRFQTPSKQESEQFYSFIKNKWQTTGCSSECRSAGMDTALQYAVKMKVPLDHINVLPVVDAADFQVD